MKIKEILSHYTADNPGTIAKLERMFLQGRLAGSGKMVILPVDQGFEHGPARSFAPNPSGYDPFYHPQLALDAGLSAYAAPLGFIEAIARDFAGKLPLILKLNNHDVLMEENNPVSAITGSVDDALRLGCVAIGFTVYPGSEFRADMYEQIREIAEDAKSVGLAVVVWSYPRGQDLSKEGETAIDVGAYAAQIACQLGAHIAKIKLPSDYIEQDAARKVYEAQKIPIGTMAERVRHIMQAAFDGKRIVIFSGGAKAGDESVFEAARAIKEGGGFGSIIGRNVFQRPRAEALKLLDKIIEIYKS
ncbi:MAG: class I fructose-bisphosphate aldolase [bacterium]|nr:class I fructose-bisphosphate aldolase [bacterium]